MSGFPADCKYFQEISSPGAMDAVLSFVWALFQSGGRGELGHQESRGRHCLVQQYNTVQ